MIQDVPISIKNKFKVIKFKDTVKGKEVSFKVLGSVKTLPKFNKITSVSVVAYTDNGNIVVVKINRGLDIPGGHVEKDDISPISTAIREADEEASIELQPPFYLTALIESDYRGKSLKDTTYMLIISCKVACFKPFVNNIESTSRLELDPTTFLSKYSGGSFAMMEEVIVRSELIWKHALRLNNLTEV